MACVAVGTPVYNRVFTDVQIKTCKPLHHKQLYAIRTRAYTGR